MFRVTEYKHNKFSISYSKTNIFEMFHLLIESFNQFPFAILSTLYFISFPLIYYKITINTTHFEVYDFFRFSYLDNIEEDYYL